MPIGTGVLRQVVIDKHMKARAESVNNANFTCSYMTYHEGPNSLMPLVDLDKREANLISLKQVYKMGHFVHGGKFLLLRSIAPSFVAENDVINLVADDPTGDLAMLVSLFNFNTSISPNGVPATKIKEIEMKIPVGTIFALMNPWCKIVQNNAPYALICQNPMHFVILGKHHPLSSIQFEAPLPFPCEELKLLFDGLEPEEAGSKYFSNRNYLMAIECFKKGKDLGKQCSNLATSYLSLGQFEKALLIAEKGLEIEPKSVSLRVHFAQALFSLKRFEECLDFLKNNNDFGDIPGELFATVERAVEESKFGQYQLFDMYEEASTKSPYLEKHADFFAKDLIEILDDLPGFKYLVQAKTDLEPGTLIMASKATAFWAPPPGTTPPPHEFIPTGRYNLMSIVSARLAYNPALFQEFLRLYDGEEAPAITGAVTNHEAFTNSWIASHTTVQQTVMASDVRGSKPLSKGVWLLPAYINHSCVDVNCVRHFIGAFMFVRTVKSVKKGEQLLMSQMPVMEDGDKRQKVLVEMRRTCNCRLCQIEHGESPEIRKKKAKLITKFEKCNRKSISTLMELLEEARAIHKGPGKLNFLALQIAKSLAIALKNAGRGAEASSLFEEVIDTFESLGLVTEALDTALCYRDGKTDDAKVASLYKIIVGDERLINVEQKI